MSGLTAVLVLGGAALLCAGHLLGRVTRVAEEAWWLAFGCGLGYVALRFDAQLFRALLPADLDATLAAALHDVLLPLVVFAGAYTVDRRCVGHHLFPVVVMPATGIAVAFALFGVVFSWFEFDGLPWLAAVLLAVILAATEAGAVTAQLKLRAPRGIRLLLDGEALFAAAIAFTLVDAMLRLPAAEVSTWTATRAFAIEFAIGAALGAGVGWSAGALANAAARRVRSTTLPHWLVLMAAIGAHAGAVALDGSGLAACLLAGLTLARLPGAAAAGPFWAPVGQGARGAVLLLVGLAVPALPLAEAWPWALAAVVLMHAARFAAVYGVTRFVHWLVKFEITRREQILISVFSTRGVTTLALAFMIPDAFPQADVIRTTALFVVAFDLLMTTPATTWLARRFANHAPVPRLFIDRLQPY